LFVGEKKGETATSETPQTSTEDLFLKDKKLRSERRKHLDERLRSIYQRAMVIERELLALADPRFYRVCIFGSARIKEGSADYQAVMKLAEILAGGGVDILTGGGPGLMEAANQGAQRGKKDKQSKSLRYGISIHLDFEPFPNPHLDIKRHHHKFSSRLDDFMRLSHSLIVTPGGIGTVLELFFAWQLIQVKHITYRPIVLLDKAYWTPLVAWLKESTLARGLISPNDMDLLSVVDTPEEAAEIIKAHHVEFRKEQEASGLVPVE
jgi:uncharacterized protein (TIGR00730 family)